MTETDLNTIYNVKTNILEYHRVIRSIKTFCSNINDPNHMKPIYHSQNEILLRHKKLTSYYSYWEQALKTKIIEKQWKSIYRNCFKTVENNDLVWFQYKLFNRILGTNKYLVKIKQKVISKCNLCKKKLKALLIFSLSVILLKVSGQI